MRFDWKRAIKKYYERFFNKQFCEKIGGIEFVVFNVLHVDDRFFCI